MQDLIDDDNLYTDEIKFAKLLVNPDKSIRDQTLIELNKYLSSIKEFNEFSMLKLWKALYYCIWLADKVPIQQELISKIINLIEIFKSKAIKLLYIQQFFRILFREWSQLDQYRVNKFYSLIRSMLYKMFDIMLNDNWSADIISSMLAILSNEVLHKVPNGIRYHITDIYLEELYKLTNGEIETKIFIELMKPYLSILTEPKIDSTFIDRIYKMLFQKYLTDFSNESYLKTSKTNPITDDQNIDNIKETRTIFKNMNTKYLQKLIFDTASDENTLEFCRKKLYQLHKQISNLTNIDFIKETYEQLVPSNTTIVAKVVSKSKTIKSNTNNRINNDDTSIQNLSIKKNDIVINDIVEGNKKKNDLKSNNMNKITNIDETLNDKKDEKINKRGVHKIDDETNISSKKTKIEKTAVINVIDNKNIPDTNILQDFIESKKFVGEKKGYIFKKDKKGLGYYLDINKPTHSMIASKIDTKKVKFGKLEKFSTTTTKRR